MSTTKFASDALAQLLTPLVRSLDNLCLRLLGYEKFGTNLSLTGPPEFQRRAEAVAVNRGLLMHLSKTSQNFPLFFLLEAFSNLPSMLQIEIPLRFFQLDVEQLNPT